MPSEETSRRVYALIDPVVTEEGCDLLDVELLNDRGRRVLRISVDKPSGVSVDECARVSQAIEDLITVEGNVPGPYDLEVSSPGPRRPITKSEHYQRALGGTVEIQTTEKISERWNFKGVLADAGNDAVVVRCGENEFRLPREMIRRARHLTPVTGPRK